MPKNVIFNDENNGNLMNYSFVWCEHLNTFLIYVRSIFYCCHSILKKIVVQIEEQINKWIQFGLVIKVDLIIAITN
jgi:hypothetical protein